MKPAGNLVAMDSEKLVKDVADRVREAIDSAERSATEIVKAAEAEAADIRESAREEARRMVANAEDAISQLVGQAESLRDRLSGEAEINPAPVVVPEPEPPLEPEPGPVTVPEPEPPLEPEPTPEPVPEPTPPAPPEPAPPEPPSEPVAATSPSTDQLIAQLKSSAGAKPIEPRSPGLSDDKAAARLVAMNMAMDGASREQIDRHLAENYSLEHRDKLLDDVIARAQR
jgi:outer membrane biosynthesis protein TonB